MAKLVYILVTLSLFQFTLAGINNNEIEDGLVETVNDMLSGNNGPDLGAMFSNFMASDGAKQMGQMLLGGGPAGAAAGDILQGIGSMMSGNQKAGGGGLDLTMLTTIMGMMNSFSNSHGHHEEKSHGGSSGGGFDFSSAIALANSFIKQDDSNEMIAFLPPLLELFSAFFGPEAEQRAHDHAGHSWFLPPIVEKMHIFMDVLMNSKVGHDLVAKIGAQKIVKIFSDKHGRFSYSKFVEMLENHSFRAHWIEMITAKVAQMLSYIADPYTQQNYVKTGIFFINNILMSQGLPAQSVFEPSRPTESIVDIARFFSKRYLNIDIDISYYVRPFVEYIQELLRLAEHKGILGRGIDSSELTRKLTDTINYEIIEPIARVNRAVRYSTRHPKCTKYVLCAINEDDPNDKVSLPGLKKTLSQAVTLGACWYMSGHEHMDFWTLYGAVSKGTNCHVYHHEECQAFHLEDLKAREAYVHNEL